MIRYPIRPDILNPAFHNRLVMIGCGTIGQAILPILGKHLDGIYSRITILSADDSGREIADHYDITYVQCALHPDNFRATLDTYISEGDLLLNLSVDVSSIEIARYCMSKGALYVDTSIEPWPGVYDNPDLSLRDRTNYFMRKDALALAADFGASAPTAVLDHGANPGLVSHFVKQALTDLNQAIRNDSAIPGTREEWAQLAADLRVSTIQISERDTQASHYPKRQGEFINTWSIEGYVGELIQPAELSFGTAEKRMPAGAAEHEPHCGSLFLQRPSASTFARSWVPSCGGFQGMLVTHDEVFSIADYLSIPTAAPAAGFAYRPSVMFVYHPCDDALLSALEFEGSGWIMPDARRLLDSDIVKGMDELGVLLAGHDQNAYWFGSQLSVQDARQHVPGANATTLQVVAGAIAAILWAIRNPRRGAVEPEDLDFQDCLAIAQPYLGKLVGKFTGWTPLDGRGKYFPENLDYDSPWQFQNIRSRQWPGE